MIKRSTETLVIDFFSLFPVEAPETALPTNLGLVGHIISCAIPADNLQDAGNTVPAASVGNGAVNDE